jgi:ComF family protein
MVTPLQTWQTIRGSSRWLVRRGTELLLPRVCHTCQADLSDQTSTADFCATCRTELASKNPCCLGCGAEIGAALTPEAHCPECRSSKFKFTRTVSLGTYEGLLRTAILRTKELSGQPVSLALTRLLDETRGEDLRAFHPDVVVPIPLHWSRRWRRGYNSAHSAGDVLARRLKLPLAEFLLRRTRHTRPQSELPPSSRPQNVRGAFQAVEHRDLVGARVLIVDDILTTGATCQEAAKVLLSAGASEIMVAVWARATH